MGESHVAGVNWASGKWLAVTFADQSYEQCIVADGFQTLWNDHQYFDRILVDVPIGLPDEKKTAASRENVDSTARAVTGFPSSVFPVPSRAAAREAYHQGVSEVVNRKNKQEIGKELTPPAYNIISHTGEVDTLLCNEIQVGMW